MNAKTLELAERIAKHIFINGIGGWGFEPLRDRIAEEIEKAKKPAEVVKTRGQVVAEALIVDGHCIDQLRFADGKPTRRVLRVVTGDDKSGVLADMRREISNAIDAERASAVAEYRERVQEIVKRNRLRGDHYLWAGAIDFVQEVLKVQADQLGNQAAADVVRK